MSDLEPGSDAWLAQVQEEIIEPERPIIDPHHHLWKKRFNRDYLLAELAADTGSGHNIVKTMFMECRAFYLREGPEHLRPLGETAAIAELARQSREDSGTASYIAGIVAHADLTLAGDSTELLLELLALHRQRSNGLLRGIRHSAAKDDRPQDLFIVGSAPRYLYAKQSFRRGIR
ncbi:MAG: amidohydrolase, partial [Proteobacteria bacterium]|nr:amidohydrolase [Pseudomonadota bacterium]